MPLFLINIFLMALILHFIGTPLCSESFQKRNHFQREGGARYNNSGNTVG